MTDPASRFSGVARQYDAVRPPAPRRRWPGRADCARPPRARSTMPAGCGAVACSGM